MIQKELTLLVLLATSCLASIDEPPSIAPDQLCEDLKNVVSWKPRTSDFQYYELLQICLWVIPTSSNKKPSAERIVERIARCEKLEHTTDMAEPLNKQRVDSCRFELNCHKRFYMEENNLSPDAYKTKFPFKWRGSEVDIDIPPSDTFVDSDPLDRSRTSCSKFAETKPELSKFFKQTLPIMKSKGLEQDPGTVTGKFMSYFQRFV